MIKTGWTRISENRNEGKPARCVSCGGKGRFKVTFEDSFGKLIVTLCEDCKELEYEQLHLQSKLDWPGVA